MFGSHLYDNGNTVAFLCCCVEEWSKMSDVFLEAALRKSNDYNLLQ